MYERRKKLLSQLKHCVISINNNKLRKYEIPDNTVYIIKKDGNRLGKRKRNLYIKYYAEVLDLKFKINETYGASYGMYESKMLKYK